MTLQELRPGDVPLALTHILRTTAATSEVVQAQVETLCEYARQCSIQWDGLFAGPNTAPAGLFVALILPGRTALVLVPGAGAGQIELGTQVQVTRAGLDRLAARGLYFAQALIEPDAVGQRDVLLGAGFRLMTRLAYLEHARRRAARPEESLGSQAPLHCGTAKEAPAARAPAAGLSADIQWIPYSPETHAEFATVVSRTYEGSTDCPELTGIRPIDDVLASHKASGPFDPTLWELARVGDRDVGCLLLSRLVRAPMLELVYLGVVPEFRRRGAGRLLLRRAFDKCESARAAQLTVVVDERNAPAKRLYAEFGLLPAAWRDVCWFRW